MKGVEFSQFISKERQAGKTFEDLLKLFLEMMVHTSGNVGQAMSWLTELDKQYKITDPSYGIGDFYEDLKKKGFIEENQSGIKTSLTAKTEQLIRKKALSDVFGKLKKGGPGQHVTKKNGKGDEVQSDTRKFQFGDSSDHIDFSESIRNGQINNGLDEFLLTENDLEVRESERLSNTSTVLMVDISHSMILYGEDRITPAKKVAMALAEWITTHFPKDTLDIIVFGNDAWQIQLKDLPYLNVGPYHTNTVAGLELAMDLLRRKKNANKQIFMITDGKPTCIKSGDKYYKNSFGLDPKILFKTLTLAAQCRKIKIPITTFMIASDPYLQEFVHEFTKTNHGRAYFSGLDSLGEFVLADYNKNRRSRV